jgi:hypothetical protein
MGDQSFPPGAEAAEAAATAAAAADIPGLVRMGSVAAKRRPGGQGRSTSASGLARGSSGTWCDDSCKEGSWDDDSWNYGSWKDGSWYDDSWHAAPSTSWADKSAAWWHAPPPSSSASASWNDDSAAPPVATDKD